MTDKYVPAIGDHVRIVDGDYLNGRPEYVGTVTDTDPANSPRSWFNRPHPIKVTADDDGVGSWYAVEVELIETAAEIAAYEKMVGADPEPSGHRVYSRYDHEALIGKPSPAGEVRVTSSTGASKGSKVARFDLIPTGPLWELAEHYGKGAQKYERVNGKDNWRNGYDWSLSYAALQRHATAFWNGEDIDPENGSKHIIAAAWHCLALAHFANDEALREQFDDRQEGV